MMHFSHFIMQYIPLEGESIIEGFKAPFTIKALEIVPPGEY